MKTVVALAEPPGRESVGFVSPAIIEQLAPIRSPSAHTMSTVAILRVRR
jgi:hypothetical protein